MALNNPQEVILTRPTCCEFSGGRVFYGSENTVYYSQVMEGSNVDKLSKCYQQNDPTSEHVSDLIATDGGTIQIDNATKIIQIKKFATGVLVYSRNGVWFISGGESGFTATNFSNNLVHEAGCISPQSVVGAEDKQYYWSLEGIYEISLNEFGKAIATNIIETTSQSQFSDIPVGAKEKATGIYNRIKRQIEWHYPKTAQDNLEDFQSASDASIVFDIRLGGIWPQEYNSVMTQGVGSFIGSAVNTEQGTEDFDSVQVIIKTTSPSNNVFNYQIDFGTKTDNSFNDFGTSYPTAFIESGYETLNKPSNKKVAPYITTHFLQTEQNWIQEGTNLVLDNQSSCKMRAKWDWDDSSANGRWSPEQQAYRFRRHHIPTGIGAFESGQRVIVTKNKVLGRGEALTIRFEQEAGKDMQLLGYTATYSIKGRM